MGAQTDRDIAARTGFRVGILDGDRCAGRSETGVAAQLHVGVVGVGAESAVDMQPDLRFGEPDPPALAVTGDVVLWGWYMEGTHRGPLDPPGFAPTGRHMRVDGFDQWTMRDSQIARYRAFYDMNDVARQLGIVPAPGSRAERGMVALQRLQARLSR